MIISNVDLIAEGNSYKVDGSSRVVIPSYIKNKFGIANSDYMEYFTAYVNGEWFLCMRRDKERSETSKTGK